MYYSNSECFTRFKRVHFTRILMLFLCHNCYIMTFVIMTTKERKDFAKGLFLRSDYSIKEIAAKVPCTEKTLRKWVKVGGWKLLKDMQTITRTKLLHDAYKQLSAVNKHILEELNGIPNKQLSDAKGVLIKEIEALSDTPLHLHIQVVSDIENWLKDNNPKDFMKVKKVLFDFIQSKAEAEGLE